MDNRLVLTVLFVTLSWISSGTYAQTTALVTAVTPAATTAAPVTTATTAAPVTTATPVTGATTAAPVTGATTAATTAAPVTTAATAATTAATTAAPVTGVTTAATTAAPVTTAATAATTAVATAAPPLVTNITVVTLPAAINNTGCGSQQLCASEPSECNPSVAGSCFFLSAKQQSGNNFDFGLSGESDGYISATLSTDNTLGGNDPTYVCANNNGVVRFFSTVLGDNGQLTMANLSVNTVRGRVSGRTIQCTFAATIPTARTRATPVTLSVGTGTFNSASGALGAPTAQLRSNIEDLANPMSNVTNLITSNTITLQQSLTQVLLITMGLLGLAAL